MKFGRATSKGALEDERSRSRRGNEAQQMSRSRRANEAEELNPAEIRLLTSAATRASGFTLAEVLAALMFLAIVIPVAVEALHIASVSGEIAVRKAVAARIADNVLNESIATTNWNQSASGTVKEDGHEFQWSLHNELWQADSGMQLLTAEVTFSAQGRNYAVHLSTLENPLNLSTTTVRP
jgi:hypothetical protein